jgi:hypothetical protein
VVPGENAALQIWILGSSSGECAELIITTIPHDHADRVRSYQLLAEEWDRR